MSMLLLVSALQQAVGVIEMARSNGAWDHESTDEQDSIDEVNTVLIGCEEALEAAKDSSWAVMLAALKDVRDSGLIECCCGRPGGKCDGTCTITLVTAAIKKAERK